MKKAVLSVIMLSAVLSSSAQLVPVQSKKLWGYSDADGNIVVEPKYTAVGYFDGGYAWVNSGGKIKHGTMPEGGKWGVIDSLGEIVCPVEYEMVDLCDGKYVAVNEGGKMKDTTLYGGKWGFYSLEDKKTIMEPIYSGISQMMAEKGAWVSTADISNNYQIRTNKDVMNGGKDVYWTPKFYVTDEEPIAYERNWSNKKSFEWRFVDPVGNVLCDGAFSEVHGLQNGLFIVEKGDLYGRTDLEGKTVMPCEYDWIGRIGSCDVFWASTGGKRYLYSKDGVRISEKGYSKTSVFYDSVAFAAEKDSTCCLINCKGEELTPFVFNKIFAFHNGFAAVHSGGKLYIIDMKGNKLLNTDFRRVPTIFGRSVFKSDARLYSYGVRDNGKTVWFDEKGNILEDNTKSLFGIKDQVPEGLWDY